MRKRVMEFRALPALEEKRNALVEEMETIVNKSKAETRALFDDEQTRFDEIKKEIDAIDKTISADEEMRGFEKKKPAKKNTEEEQRAIDEKSFLDYIRTGQIRALGVTDNGAAIIPTEIAKRIVEKVKELSPIYQMATKFNVSGDLQFPVEDTSTGKITAAYVDDLTELVEGTGKFTSIKLQNHIVGALSKISKSLINRSGFDLLSYVVRKIAEAISEFLEKELITGNAGKMKGLVTTTNTVPAAAANAVTADELIDLQLAVPEVLKKNPAWIMHKDTFKAVRKLKYAATGEYLMIKDPTQGPGWMLLGEPVYISENCPKMEANKKAIFYGEFDGLYVKLANDVQIQVLNEKYATQYAVGAVGYVEVDSAIVESQKIAALLMDDGL